MLLIPLFVRRQRRKDVRAQKWHGMRPRTHKYLAPWSSTQARAESCCQTHKEGEQHVAAASKSAGFLLAVSSGGMLWLFVTLQSSYGLLQSIQ